MGKRLSFVAAGVLACGAVSSRADNFTKGVQHAALTPQLKPGDYVWNPEVSPAGPVVMIVSLKDQTLYLYRNGVRIGRSTISSGKTGHVTPTGVFTILQKKAKHTSSIYKGASMPYMQRLTWDGIALHAGNLPGFPASHGCVRLPLDFAQKLFTVTSAGTTVVVTNGKADPGTTSRPGMLLSGKTGETGALIASGDEFAWHPEKSPSGPVSIIFSTPDQRAYVLRNGVEIGRASITGSGLRRVKGSHAYAALDSVNADGSRNWSELGSAGGSRAPDLAKLKSELVIPPDFLANARAAVSPGATLIITDLPVDNTTRSGSSFNILNAGR